jgi:hypothetical protein
MGILIQLFVTLLVTTGQQPAPLSQSDLVIAGLAWGADTGVTRRALGPPQAIRRFNYPGDDEVLHLNEWRYHDLLVTFSENGHQYRARLTGPSRATARGLRVGDSVRRVNALYGPPKFATASALYYSIEHDPPTRLGMIVEVRDDRVTAILVGIISTGD